MAVAATSAISIQQVSYRYAGKPEPALRSLNLEIAAGERFGLLGPNGAGKTTLMNLMTGALQLKEVSIRLMNHDIQAENNAAKKLFGFIPQQHSFYKELSALENLEFFGAWAGLNRKEIKQRSEELMATLGLSHAAHQPVSTYSGGMKSRVNLAIGVIHRPQILFLDEPTTGVDVQSRHAILQYLRQLNAAGTTLVYTSHLLSEAEKLCTRVALIDEGTLIAHDNVPNLLTKHQHDGLEGLFLELTGRSYRDY